MWTQYYLSVTDNLALSAFAASIPLVVLAQRILNRITVRLEGRSWIDALELICQKAPADQFSGQAAKWQLAMPFNVPYLGTRLGACANANKSHG